MAVPDIPAFYFGTNELIGTYTHSINISLLFPVNLYAYSSHFIVMIIVQK